MSAINKLKKRSETFEEQYLKYCVESELNKVKDYDFIDQAKSWITNGRTTVDNKAVTKTEFRFIAHHCLKLLEKSEDKISEYVDYRNKFFDLEREYNDLANRFNNLNKAIKEEKRNKIKPSHHSDMPF